MEGRQACIARFRDDMVHLLAVVAALPQERRQQPLGGDRREWTAKDVLTHIAAWDRELVHGVNELLAGQRPSYVAQKLDAFNARAVAAARDLPWNAIVTEMHRTHEALIERMSILTDEEWWRPSAFTWRNGRAMTVASLFDYSYQGETHYRGHARELAEITPR